MFAKHLVSILIFFSLAIGHIQGQKIDFDALQSPILFEGDYKYAYRDPAVVYHDDQFYLFFTLVERAADGGMYLFTATSISHDLVHWTYPEKITPRDRNLNYSSPGNIIRHQGEWIMCLQSYPTPGFETWGNQNSRIWTMRSQNLIDWEDPELLRVKGQKTPVSEMGRMIDPYLIEDQNEPGKWWCFYKQNGVSMSYSYNLKTWTYVGHADSGENVTVLSMEGDYLLFHSPPNGIGVKRSKRLNQWGEDEMLITLGQKDWPWAARRLTAATVIDLTTNDDIGKYLMFFHGSSIEGAKPKYNAHNNASLAIAWSNDLINWDWPGKSQQ